MTVTNAWVGAPTTEGAQIVTKTAGAGDVRILVSANADLSSPTGTTPLTPDVRGISRHTVTGLDAGTAYYWGAEQGGTTVYSSGRLRTLPGSGPQSFRFAFASCLSNKTNETDTFTKIDDKDPVFFWLTGDMNYGDVNSTNPDLYRAQYDNQLGLAGLGSFVRAVPTFYTWSDHDFSGNASTSQSTGAATHQGVYRERVPHLALPSTAGGIFCTFTVGRVRFIGLDTRSQRVNGSTFLGAEQLEWLEALLAAETLPLTFIISAEPWDGGGSWSDAADNWGGFPAERATVASWIAASATTAVILSGDAHYLAADDGTNSPHGVPIINAAPIGHTAGAVKSGPHSHGKYTVNDDVTLRRHYGLMDVTDDGAGVTAQFSGMDAAGGDVERISMTVTGSGSNQIQVNGKTVVGSWTRSGGLAVAASRFVKLTRP